MKYVAKYGLPQGMETLVGYPSMSVCELHGSLT